MSFLTAARAALADQNGLHRSSHLILLIMALLLAGLFPSCGSHSSSTPNHNAYVSLPGKGSVALVHINGGNGELSLAAKTPQVEGTSPKGLALLPSKKFLYAVNSAGATISIFRVASDGTLTLSATPTPEGGSGPDAAVIDPSGKYLLVTNNLSNDVSVFSIDSGSGALSQVAGSPFYANSDPSEILITPSGKFVYVTNPGTGMVTGFTFSNGVLNTVPNTPTISGSGAIGLAVDLSGRFLYVANASALNSLVPTVGNISGFNIDSNSGALTPIIGSPFTVSQGNGPTAITVDPSGRFVYAVTTGTSYSIWGFAITATNGQLTPLTNSAFSLTAGGLFALIDPSRNRLYVGSAASNGVAGFTYDPSTGAPTAITNSPFSTGSPPGKMVLSE